MTDEVRSSLREMKEIQRDRVQKVKKRDDTIADLERTVEFTEDRLNSIVATLHTCQEHNLYLKEENKMLLNKLAENKIKPQPPPIRHVKEGQIPEKGPKIRPTWPGWWIILACVSLMLITVVYAADNKIENLEKVLQRSETTASSLERTLKEKSLLLEKEAEMTDNLNKELEKIATDKQKVEKELKEVRGKFLKCIEEMEKYFERMKIEKKNEKKQKRKENIIMCDHTDPLSCIIEQHKPLKKEEINGASVSSNSSRKINSSRFLFMPRHVGGKARNQPY